MLNGEVYNHSALRSQLSDSGHTFRGRSDTEVLLAALQTWGRDAFARCNGMWAVALWDRDERTLLLCRDRFGVKPLFYTFVDGVFSFASEAKALIGEHGIPFEARADVVTEYLTSGALPSPSAGDSFFSGVHSLPPGHWLQVKDGQLSLERYYYLPSAADTDATDAEIVAGYRALLEDSVHLRLVADVLVRNSLPGEQSFRSRARRRAEDIQCDLS